LAYVFAKWCGYAVAARQCPRPDGDQRGGLVPCSSWFGRNRRSYMSLSCGRRAGARDLGPRNLLTREEKEHIITLGADADWGASLARGIGSCLPPDGPESIPEHALVRSVVRFRVGRWGRGSGMAGT